MKIKHTYSNGQSVELELMPMHLEPLNKGTYMIYARHDKDGRIVMHTNLHDPDYDIFHTRYGDWTYLGWLKQPQMEEIEEK
jgi:hypothetical protein